MRPERAKRPRIAADGTELAQTPPNKKARVFASPEVVVKSTLKSTKRNKAPNDDASNVALSDAEEEEDHTSASALESLSRSTIESHLPRAQRRVLSIMAGRLPPPGLDKQDRFDGSECIGLQDQWLNLRAAVKGTLQGEGNSALLVGATGCGKSLLLDSVLRSLEGEESTKKPYHLVQLDGAIQPTDRLSMRELARQLVQRGAIKLPKEGEEGALDFGPDDDETRVMEDKGEEETEVPSRVNGSDEKSGEELEQERQAVENAVLSSITNTTSTILTLLSSASNSRQGLPLIITLSSFDLYTSRPRQALLYVLLDAVQAGSYTPGLCIIGMTSRLDTTDLLEKRVRSRFGGRTINVWPEDVWIKVMKSTLMTGLSDEDSSEANQFNKAWKQEMGSVCSDKKVLQFLEDAKAICNVVRTLHKTLYPLVASLTAEEPSLINAFSQYQQSLSTLSDYSVLSDLTTAEFAVLIASKQLLNRDREVFNFEMCFDEVKKFVAKVEMDRMSASSNSLNARSDSTIDTTPKRRAIGATASTATLGWQGLTNRKRVMMAFQSLLQLELFQPEAFLKDLSIAAPATSLANKGAQTVRTEYLRVKCTIFAQDIIDAAKAPNRTEALGTHLIQWAISNG